VTVFFVKRQGGFGLSDSRVVPASDGSLGQAVDLLGRGELVAIPTETVYGLAANAWDTQAVGRIFAAKGRPANNPLIVHVASVDRVGDAIAWPVDRTIESQFQAIVDLWPGPLTIVCRRSPQVPDLVTAGLDTVAVRVPSHPVAQELLRRCPFPLAAPSANRSNYISPTTAQHVATGLLHHVSMIIDGGPCQYGLESTIVALHESGPQLLRPGGITREQLSERFQAAGFQLQEKNQPATLRQHDSDKQLAPMLAPGMMKQHYSPHTPLVLLGAATPIDVPPRTGRIAFFPLTREEASRYEVVATLSNDGRLETVAQNLFAALRRLDDQGLDQIHCDTCQPTEVGRAIMDRLDRAAAK